MMYEFHHPNARFPLYVELVEATIGGKIRVRHLTRAGKWRYIKVNTEHLRPASPPSNEYLELFK